MRILFLIPYPTSEAPSQRFRFEQYFSIMKQEGYVVRTQSFLNQRNWRLYYSAGRPIQKILAMLKGFMKRIQALAISTSFDIVFIHRELAPIGPPVFEWVIANVLRKKIIYDFDDAIWLTDREGESWLTKALRWRSKVGCICKWSYRVSCGNAYLAEYARNFNANVVINPTTIDTEDVHNPNLFNRVTDNSRISIGWTGSHSTLKYLAGIESILKELQGRHPHVSFLVIADRRPPLNLVRFEYRPWQKATEAADLMKIDIGIMPLPDDEWSKGKCGFKALQYMAMGIPCVVSPVGVNTTIVVHGETGFMATTHQEWVDCLEKLINDPSLRIRLGIKGRERVIKHYSVVSNTANFLALFA